MFSFHVKAKSRHLQISAGWRVFSVKLRFRDGLVWTVSLTINKAPFSNSSGVVCEWDPTYILWKAAVLLEQSELKPVMCPSALIHKTNTEAFSFLWLLDFKWS